MKKASRGARGFRVYRRIGTLIVEMIGVPRPRLVYQQRSLPLMGDADAPVSGDIEILYRGERLGRITKTYVVMWNAGRTIRARDLHPEDPLRFQVSGDGQILSARLVKTSSDRNISISEPSRDQRTCAITIDALNRNEGAVFEIFHTSSERFGVVRGSINGMPNGPQNRGRIRHLFNPLPWQIPSSFKAIGNTAFVLTFGIGALLVLLSAFGSYLMPPFGPHVAPVMSIIEGVSDAIYAGLALIVIAQTRQRFPEDLTIPELVD